MNEVSRRGSEWQTSIQDFGRALHEVEFVILDLETTGSAPHLGAAITEIGAVRIRGGQELATFSSLVNPGQPIPSYITALTGIDDLLVADAPVIAELLPSLIDFLGDEETIFVAQNAPFDLTFLKAACQENFIELPKQPVLDTAILARKILDREEAPNCKLGTLAKIFKAEIAPTHRALDDVYATIAVLHGLFERLAGLQIFTIEEALAFSARSRSAAKARPTYRPVQERPRNQ